MEISEEFDKRGMQERNLGIVPNYEGLYNDFETRGLLFDLEKDPEQRKNLYLKNTEVVNELAALLKKELERSVYRSI